MGPLSPSSGDVRSAAPSRICWKPGPPSEVRLAGGDRRGAEASPVDVHVQHRRGRGCVPGTFLGLCNSFRVEEGRAKQATSLQGNPNNVGFTSLQGLGPHLLPDGHRRSEGFSDGALEEGNGVVGGDPLGHPQGNGQLALFVLAALQLLIADGAGVSSALVGVEEGEVSSGLEVPGPEAVREFTGVGGK